MYFIHSAALPGIYIFEPLRVYEPGFNTDKYGSYVYCIGNKAISFLKRYIVCILYDP